MVGILHGGGVDCSKLDDEGYNADGTGTWMRVAAFREVVNFINITTTVGLRKLKFSI